MKISARERQLLTLLVVLFIVYLSFQILSAVWSAAGRLADVIIVFGAAWAFSFVLSPLVDRLDRSTRLNRTGAVLVVYVGIAIVLAGLGAFAVPRLAEQLAALSTRAPELARSADKAAHDFQAQIDSLGLPLNVVPLYEALPGRLGELAGAFASDALGVVSATAATLFNVVLVLIIAFLMLIDGGSMWNQFTAVLSDDLRSEAELLRISADKAFGGFVRGSLLLGLIYGVATLLILVPLGVPFSGVLAVFSGLVVMIPFFGPILAIIPVLGITFLGAPNSFIPVAILSIVLQQVVLNIIGPQILSKSIGIHPIFVFLALLVGSRIAGFWGLLLGVPVAGLLNTLFRYIIEVTSGRRRRSEAASLMQEPFEPLQ
ncbi:MAG TPA: AI-2E family transporter [Candidatus Limnocylindria bacterium]|nr:AI-2E family transporter [Candidatus Limnocylindria bacterium]